MQIATHFHSDNDDGLAVFNINFEMNQNIVNRTNILLIYNITSN